MGNDMKSLLHSGAAFLSLGAASFSAISCSENKELRPNVLLIIVDDLKPSLGCYGDAVAHTPHIDGIAEDGSVFTHAYCQQALSGPSRASLMTGLRPDENGVTELNTWIRKKKPDIVTLPQAFRQAGYHTVSIGKTFHGKRNTLDSLSWSEAPALYHYTKSDEYMLQANRTGKKAASHEFYDGPEDTYLDMMICKEAARRLDSLAHMEKPFFLAVGFLKPHLPFCAPERFHRLYSDTDFSDVDTTRIAGAPDIAYHNSEELRGYTDIGEGEIDNILLKKAYYACVSFTDENIGKVISHLKKSGLYDDTVIIIAGDHGYHTGEQGLWCKSTNYEQACRTPLIIKDAGQRKANRISVPVELIDIFPTLASMCGIPEPENLSGKDLTNLDIHQNHYAFSQFPRPYPALHKASARTHVGYSVRDERWRYVEWYDNDGHRTATELYDLKDSGMETENVSGKTEFSDIEARLRNRLRQPSL